MKKYDFVKVIDYHKSDDESYNNVGKYLLGEYAMIIGIDKRTNDYQIEICFFNMNLQSLAMEYGFDYWDESELEVI